MDGESIIGRGSGVNQRGLRDHNERLLLSILQRYQTVPAAELARRTGLSKPTVSTILRNLESDGLVMRGEPVRGKVGNPSIPSKLDPDGAFSIGLKIGRRSADLLLIDFAGTVREQLHTTYDYPMPDAVFGFLKEGLGTLLDVLPPEFSDRVCGIGIGTPFELWKWHDLSGPAAEKFSSWKDIVFAEEVSKFSQLQVHVVNDSTAACHAEHLYGNGNEYSDYAYFFIGSFIGGGIAMNGTVFEGNQGNAGALGSMRTTGPLGESQHLIDTASIHLLETWLVEAGINPDQRRHKPQDWKDLSRYVEPWIGETAQELAKATLSICSVIDFQAVLIDGAFPTEIREELVERVQRYLVHQDKRGLIEPKVQAGTVGENARAIGAASGPIFAQFFLNTNAGLSSI
jgi:predicted NBD/HSP70 family sugar kinase